MGQLARRRGSGRLTAMAALWGAGVLALAPDAGFGREQDVPDLSLEELSQIRVIRTPKLSANPEYVPSAVSILTRQDIQTFGWRTLADALRTLNGFNVTNDHTYAYAGVRGVSPAGDYRSRVQVLIDGLSVNENIYASSSIDSAFPVDLDLVDHIEIIRGPSASVFGGDSTFGVINVVTRRGGSLKGFELSGSQASGRASEGRVTWGGVTESGADVLVSYTGAYAAGRRLRLADEAWLGTNVAQGVEGETAGKFFARMSSGDWRATLIHSVRDRSVPTGTYGTDLNDTGHREADRYTLAEVNNEIRLARQLSLQSRLYAGQYEFRGDYPYTYPPYVLNRDRVVGQWWGFESRLVATAWNHHTWTGGFEYKADLRQNQHNDDLGYGCFGISTTPCLDDRRQSRQAGIYLQDEIAVADSTHLTFGLRYDHATSMRSHWSPRLGLVMRNDAGGTFKLLYATAFSDPSVYQRFYSLPTFGVGNPAVRSESMRSLDLTWEQRLGAGSRLTATAYFFRLRDMLAQDSASGLTTNFPGVTGRGLEFEFEQRWSNLTALRAGYSLSLPSLDGGALENSSRHQFHANLSVPLGHPDWRAGLEGQALSRRRTGLADTWVPGYGVANANILYRPSNRPWEMALGVYNLTDHHYRDPVALDTTLAGTRDRMVQLGRTLRLKFTTWF